MYMSLRYIQKYGQCIYFTILSKPRKTLLVAYVKYTLL